MQLKGLLAYGIKRARELYYQYLVWNRTSFKRMADSYYNEYEAILEFLQGYYGLKESNKWNLLERLVLNKEVEV